MAMFKNIDFLSVSMVGEEDFFRVYPSIPIDERKLTIVVIDAKPISWDLAYQEIKNKTERGKKILKILRELDII